MNWDVPVVPGTYLEHPPRPDDLKESFKFPAEETCRMMKIQQLEYRFFLHYEDNHLRSRISRLGDTVDAGVMVMIMVCVWPTIVKLCFCKLCYNKLWYKGQTLLPHLPQLRQLW